MALRKGMDQVEAAIERAKSGGDRTPTNFFKWSDKETKAVRFLTDGDDIFVLQIHDWTLCKDGKHRSFVCRKEVGEHCELCDNKVASRELGWGVAVLREPVYEEADGRRRQTGYKDYTEEYETEQGEKKIRPYVGVIRQAPGNFWTYVQAVYEKKGSLRTQDLEIMRKGDDKNTSYIVFPGDPVVEIENIDERYAKYVPDLAAMLEGMASDEYYKAHLHGIRKERSNEDGDGQTESSNGSSPSSDQEELDEQTEFERLKAEQERLQGASAGEAYS